MNRARQNTSTQGHSSPPRIGLLLLVILILVPLHRGGLGQVTQVLLQYAGLVLTAAVLWQRSPSRMSRNEALFLALLFAVPFFYIVPAPSGFVDSLPGRELYARAAAMLRGEALEAPSTLSLYPFASEAAWLMLLAPIGIYLGTRALDETRQLTLVYVFLAVALAESILAALQFGAAVTGIAFPFAELVSRNPASGTFVNRNHMAGMMEMAFPIALALFLYNFGRHGVAAVAAGRGRERILTILQAAGRPSLGLAMLAVLFITAIVVTKSRAGIALAMLGIVVSGVVFSRRLGGEASFGLVGQLVTVAVALALALGLAPVLDRFSTAAIEGDARWPLAEAVLNAAGRMMPFGSGPGTFSDVFPLYQPFELGRFFVNQAHNDYLQVLFELGLPGLVLVLLFVGFAVRQWFLLTTPEAWSQFRSLQVGAGIGLLLLMLHSLADYNLRTPANLVYFAFLCGVFFSPPGQLELSERKRRRRRTRSLSEPDLAAAHSPVKSDQGRPKDGAPSRPNPFVD